MPSARGARGASTQPNSAAARRTQRRLQARGDDAEITASLVIVSEMLCEAANVRAGQRVLDVATGSGNTAIAAARRGCEAHGVDDASALLERGRERAAAERLTVTFSQGDADDLPFPDASFDIVLSSFGVMFAPDQAQAARELLRVCRPGGTIGLANWTLDGCMGQVLGRIYAPAPRNQLASRHMPPTAWGTEAQLKDLFGDAIHTLDVTPRNVVFRYRSAEHGLLCLRDGFGPLRCAFAALDETGQARLGSDLIELLQRFNQGGETALKVPSAYVEVIAIKW